MLTTKEVHGLRVCRPPRKGREFRKDGTPRHGRKIGKISKTVFTPNGRRVVGFIVRRPDLLFMFKRADKFLALDSLAIENGVINPSKGADSWDERAIKRLNINFDKCIIWEGIEVQTTKGESIGHVSNLSFDEKNGKLNSYYLDDGSTARRLLGAVEIPGNYTRGYHKGILIVDTDAAKLKPSGGLAAKAGETTAKIGYQAEKGAKVVRDTGKKVADTTKDTVNATVENYRREAGIPERKDGKTTTQAAAEAVGKHLKGASTMFQDFKKELDKELNN